MWLKPIRNRRGQSLIEYVVLVALVGCATVGMVRVLQKSIKGNLAEVVYVLQGHEKRVSHETISESDLHKADFSDFMNGTASRK